MPNCLNVSSCSNWLANLLCPDDSILKLDDTQMVWILMTLWYIWKGRDEFIFYHKGPNPMGTLQKLKANVT